MTDIAARAAVGRKDGRLFATIIVQAGEMQLVMPVAVSAALRAIMEDAEARAETMTLEAAASPLTALPTAGNA